MAKNEDGSTNSTEQTGADDNMPGHSKYRAILEIDDPTVTAKLGLGSCPFKHWTNIYFNFYGAKSGSALTFHQNDDIAHLSQAQFRQLIDVSDLGQGGWNGQNIDPNAPQVLDYNPGTEASKTFYMTWAPDDVQTNHGANTPSTATVGNSRSLVRIHFNDGTYLDVPGNYTVDPQTTPSTENFTQDIQYMADRIVVKTVSRAITGTLIGGRGTVNMNHVNNLIDGNMPAGYHYVSGKLTADETVTNTTPAALVVYVAKDTPDVLTQGEVVITYIDKDDPSHILGSASVTGNDGASVNVKATIEGNVPAHWKIDPDYTMLTTATVPGLITVPLVHTTKTVKPGDPGVDPSKPLYQNMFKTVTRTIKVHNPNGTIDQILQQVQFNRSETIDEVTGQVISYGIWSLVADSAPDWGEFYVPQLSGYTSFVDGNAATQVNEEVVTPDTADTTIEVTYQKADEPGHDDHGKTPTNPDDHNKPADPGDHQKPVKPDDHSEPHTPVTPGHNGSDHHKPTNAGKIVPSKSSSKASQAENKQILPQSGNAQNVASIIGLGLLGFTTMLGIGALNKHN